MINVEFKYVKKDGTIELGVPNVITCKNGNYRDGGCEMFFETSQLSIGIEEKFSLYLYAEDINDLTFKIWKTYIETEPERAKKDFEKIIKLLKNE